MPAHMCMDYKPTDQERGLQAGRDGTGGAERSLTFLLRPAHQAEFQNGLLHC